MGAVTCAVVAALVLGCASASAAEETTACTATGTVDRATITIGEPISYTVTVECPEGTRMMPPTENTSWAPFEVKDERRGPQAAQPEGRVRGMFEYTLTAYQTGKQTIPAVSVIGVGDAGNVRVKTAPIAVTVESVNPSGKFEDIRPLKGPITSPAPHRGLVVGGLIVFVAMLAALAAWGIKRRKRQPQVLPPPWVTARDELRGLSSQGLIDQKALKEHYERLGDIMRAYLAARYQDAGMDDTTEELLAALKDSIDPSAVSETGRLLSICDLVKFANHVPSTDEHAAVLSAAQRLIDRTVPREAPEPVKAS